MDSTPPPLPQISEAKPEDRGKFFHTTANVAIGCLVAGCVFSFLVTAQTNKIGGVARLIGVAVPAILWVAAMVAGVIALVGVRKHGTTGLLWKGLAGLVVPIALMSMAVPAFQKVREISLHKRSEAIAAEISKTAPKMIDEVTRLDGAAVGPGEAVTVNYTVISVEAKNLDLKAWNTKVVPMIRHNVLQTPMGLAIKEGTTIIFTYKDKKGAVFSKVVFDPKDEK